MQRLMRKALHFSDLLKEIFKRGINKLSFYRTLSAGTRLHLPSAWSILIRAGVEEEKKIQTNKRTPTTSNTCARPEPLPWEKHPCLIKNTCKKQLFRKQ